MKDLVRKPLLKPTISQNSRKILLSELRKRCIWDIPVNNSLRVPDFGQTRGNSYAMEKIILCFLKSTFPRIRIPLVADFEQTRGNS
jgi:hypothetical protein